MNEPTVASRAVLDRLLSADTLELPAPSVPAANLTEPTALTPGGSQSRADRRWPIPAPDVPSRCLPTPARAAAAARLFRAIQSAPHVTPATSGAMVADPATAPAPTPTAPVDTPTPPVNTPTPAIPTPPPPVQTPAPTGTPDTAGPAPADPTAARHTPASIPAALRGTAASAPVAAATATATAPAATPESPEPAEEEARRHLRAVPPRTLSPAQRRRRTRALLLMGAGVVIAVAFSLVYLHVVLAQRQFTLDRLTQRVQTDRSTYERLRVQVAELGSPANIISRAEGQLGMRQPSSVTYLTPTVTIGGSAASNGLASPAGGPVQAPAGVADWPQIKAQLAGSP